MAAINYAWSNDFNIEACGFTNMLFDVRGISLYKNKGDVSDGDNYRFLCVNGVIVKVVAKVMMTRFYSIAVTEGLINKEQMGF